LYQYLPILARHLLHIFTSYTSGFSRHLQLQEQATTHVWQKQQRGFEPWLRAAALAASLKRGAWRHDWLLPDMQSLTLNAEDGNITLLARRLCPTQYDNPLTAQLAAIAACS
jgi:hypothetical protein